MPGVAGRATRVSPSIGHQPRAVGSSNETGARGHAKDLPHIGIVCKGDVPSASHSTPSAPDIDKDLPRIPSTSTGLWGTEPATISSEMIDSLLKSPTPSPQSYPVSQNLRRIPTTEAQRIAAQYRRRYGSLEALKSEISYPNNLRHLAEVDYTNSRAGPPPATSNPGLFTEPELDLVVDDPYSEERPSVEIDPDVSSFLPVSPTIRRHFAQEVDMATISESYVTEKVPERVSQGGTFPCPQRGCHGVLASREAYACHIHIHLIHEGLRECELCGARFADDDHKNDHLNSCPKLPIFHEIESFKHEPPVGPLQNLLNRFHL